jgi:cytochrome c peroxidase
MGSGTSQFAGWGTVQAVLLDSRRSISDDVCYMRLPPLRLVATTVPYSIDGQNRQLPVYDVTYQFRVPDHGTIDHDDGKVSALVDSGC